MGEPKIYTGNGWEIRCGRWQDSPPESVDVVISDPPYDERTHRRGMRGAGHPTTEDPIKIAISAPKSFGPILPVEVGPPLVLIATRWVILFCSIEQLGHYQTACTDEYIRGGAWIKKNPAPQFTGDRPGQWGDGIAILHRPGRKRWNRGGGKACWIHSTQHGTNTAEPRVHETQKPLPLMSDLVSDFSDPGELVWDPYAGSGTTGVACMRLGRRFLGHEMQPHYAQVAAERLAAEERGLTLQDARRGQQSILDLVDEDPVDAFLRGSK